MKKFTTDEIVLLLGAGASCNAGILNSNAMINRIQEKLEESDWEKFKPLYYYLKSGFYQKQIFNTVNPSAINFNIENLVELLDIVVGISNAEFDFYIFVGSWEKDLQPFINEQRVHNLVSEFKGNIIQELTESWLTPDDWILNSSYYKRIIDFKNELDGFPLKIFSLNYDLCVEQNLKGNNIELGFDENNKWSFRRYDYGDTNRETSFYLYKLHGSINWKKTGDEGLIRTEGGINTNDLAIIFGVANKLQSLDPYLFYFYEFREHCLNANLIISSGYGFLDNHINDAIKFGLKGFPHKKLVVNVYEGKPEEEIKKELAERLKLTENQILIYNKQAKEFFESDLKLENFEVLFEDEATEQLPKDF